MRSFFFVVPFMALASTAAAETAAPVKLGYVELGRALNEVEDGKAAKAKLKADFDGKQKQLDKMQSDLKAKKDEFDKKAAMMNPEAKQQRQEELQRSFLELQQTYMKLQQELSEREAKVTREIAGKIQRVIAAIGDRDGYTAIFNIGDSVVGENVLYYKRHQDITDEVVREYNRQYSGSAAAKKK